MIDPAFRIQGWRQLVLLPPSYTIPKIARKAHRFALGLWRSVHPPRLDSAAWDQILSPHGSAVSFLRERYRRPRVLAPPLASAQTNALRQFEPDLVSELAAQAQRVSTGRLELLGSGELQLGMPPEWHRDFKSGAMWPATHVSRLHYLRLGDGSDYKVPWELSRFHHGLAFAQAYALSGNERWVHLWSILVNSWLTANPVEIGVNWASPMDVAIRAVNWIVALEFLGERLDEDLAEKVVESLVWHGRYVAANLEIHRGLRSTIANNHLLANIAGLAVLGSWFDHTPEGLRWLETAEELLPGELERQVYSDGVTFEGSIPYHRLSTELVLATAMQLERARRRVPECVRSALRRMLSFIVAYTREDGSSPVIGDADDGRLWWWILPRVYRAAKTVGERYRAFLDHRHVVALGSLWLGDDDLAAQAGPVPVEVYWLLGAEAAQRLQGRTGTARLTRGSAFQRGGIFVMRRSRRHLLIDAGPHGQQGLGGHAHNDILHIELWADGVPWLVDSGVGVYAADLGVRNRMRGTRAHNTVMIDNEEQWPFDPRRPFLLPATRSPRILAWRSSSTTDWLDVESDAYSRLRSPVRHRRRVLSTEGLDGWVVADDLTGEGRHLVRWAFHFGPRVSATVYGPGQFKADHEGGARLSIGCSGFADGQFRIVDDLVSFSYGTTESTATLEWEGIVTCPLALRVTILPSAFDQPSAHGRHSALLEAWAREASL